MGKLSNFLLFSYFLHLSVEVFLLCKQSCKKCKQIRNELMFKYTDKFINYKLELIK